MKVIATTDFKEGVASAVITIGDFGGNGLTAQEEKELFNDYEIELNYATILFERLVSVTDHNDPVVVKNEAPAQEETQEQQAEPQAEPQEETSVEADLVTLAMPFETLKIKDDTEIVYRVDSRTLGDEYLNYTYIKDNVCLAKAMVEVFIDVVISFLAERMEFAKQHKDNFERVRVYTI